MERSKMKSYGVGFYRSLILAISGTILILTIQSWSGWQEFRQETKRDKAVQDEKNKNFEKEDIDLHRGIVEANDRISKKADVEYVNNLYFGH